MARRAQAEEKTMEPSAIWVCRAWEARACARRKTALRLVIECPEPLGTRLVFPSQAHRPRSFPTPATAPIKDSGVEVSMHFEIAVSI